MIMLFLFRSLLKRDHLDDDIVYWGSTLAFAEMIRGGTTSFCLMFGLEESEGLDLVPMFP